MVDLQPPVVFCWKDRPRRSTVYHRLRTSIDRAKIKVLLDVRTVCGQLAFGPVFNGRQDFGYEMTEDESTPKEMGLRFCSHCSKLSP